MTRNVFNKATATHRDLSFVDFNKVSEVEPMGLSRGEYAGAIKLAGW